MTQQDNKSINLEDRIRSIELRLSNVESALALNDQVGLSYRPDEPHGVESSSLAGKAREDGKGFESRIGGVGLALLGNLVLLFAVIFFTEYVIILGYRLLSVVVGVVSVGTIILISNYFKKSNPDLSIILFTGGQVILFYEVLRMHFFTATPLIPNKSIVIVMLLLIVTIQIYLSVQKKSQISGFLGIIFILFTGILSDTTHVMLPLVTIAAIGASFLFYMYNWNYLLLVTFLLVYAAFFMWLFGNPIMNHPMEIIGEHNYGYIYLFALGGCFSLLALIRKHDGSIDDILIGIIILNGVFFSLFLSLISTKFFRESYVLPFSVITVCCLSYSVILKSLSDWKFASAFYVLYGFLAMSISLYGMIGIPIVYLLLSVQSLIVVAMALWFKNRLIIVMNSVLFVAILIIYLLSSKQVDGVDFSFALVPLVSARIINWQKARLNIKTDLIRNAYLITGFFMVLYALYRSLPSQFVTLSWTVAALVYFLLSILLNNKKYRYMALGTMISAAIYLFIVDLARIDVVYRVLAFLFLAIVSIGISIYYNTRIKGSAHEH